MELPRSLFTPPPHVDSTLLRLTPRETAPAETLDHDTLIKTMSAAFLMRRKTMLNNLCAAFSMTREQAGAALEAAGLPASVRGEALTQEQMAALANAIYRMK